MLVVPRPLAILVLAAFVAGPLAATAHDRGHAVGLFTLVNTTPDSVMRVAFSPAGSGAFMDVALGEPLRGGLADATVHVPEGDCLRDMRVTFRDGHTHVVPSLDVCRVHRLRLSSGQRPR